MILPSATPPPGTPIHHRSRLLFTLLAVLVALCALLPAVASAGTATTKVVSYRGYELTVPVSWPVYHISSSSTVCVRFNRHAVYLGRPGSDQHCSAAAVGRTGAILVQPLSGSSAAGTGANDLTGTVTRIVNTTHQVVITATWDSASSAAVERALGLSKLSPSNTRPAASASASTAVNASSFRADTAKAAATPGEVYNGLGFDTCGAPSAAAMSAWSGSYDAVGIYIGGENSGCTTQPNLTSSWVSKESSAGWHMIPVYVGLQATTTGCSDCETLTASKAASQGASDAATAVADAKAIGIGPGNPIYDDMEGYNPTSAAATAVLAFLQGWSKTLHTDGYLSGVYSSDDSGIMNLAAKAGSGYTEPDDIWFAAWNGAKNVSDTYATTSDWPDGRRLHQYNGNVTATEGGYTLSIDQDWLDGQTAASGTTAIPVAKSSPTIYGTPVAGQVLTDQHASWSNSPLSYSYQWQRCNASGVSCANISGATARTYTIPAADAGDTIRVIEKAKNGAGTGTAVDSAVTAKIASTASGYWQYTAYGNVYNSLYEPFYGSLPASGISASNVVGLARTSNSKGYWMVTSAGKVYAFGDATKEPAATFVNRVVGIVANPAGKGYWIVTANGNVHTSGTSFYGSPSASHITVSNIVGMAATSNGKGYWLVTATGKVYAYGNATTKPAVTPAHPITGIVANPSGGGYWLVTAYGNIYNAGTSWYGSPSASRVTLSNVAGLAATSNGKGYWVVTATSKAYAYGNATTYSDPVIAHPVVGAAGGS